MTIILIIISIILSFFLILLRYVTYLAYKGHFLIKKIFNIKKIERRFYKYIRNNDKVREIYLNRLINEDQDKIIEIYNDYLNLK